MFPSARNLQAKAQLVKSSSAALPFKWLYATDVPETKPARFHYKPTPPRVFTPFPARDAARLESAWQNRSAGGPQFVSVLEDHLMQVDIGKLLLGPIYWEGPCYSVRRGVWFLSQGTSQIPLAGPVTELMEDLYAKAVAESEKTTGSVALLAGRPWGVWRSSRVLFPLGEDKEKDAREKLVIFGEECRIAYVCDAEIAEKAETVHPALLPGSLRLNRGWQDDLTTKLKEKTGEAAAGPILASLPQGLQKLLASKSGAKTESSAEAEAGAETETEATSEAGKTTAKAEDAFEAQWGDTMATSGDDADTDGHRSVDHLVLCIHGVGQALDAKVETIGFAHTVNSLRRVLKSTFHSSEELQAAVRNAEKPRGSSDADPESANCRVQVLPVSWRSKTSFSTAETEFNPKDPPTLSDISVKGIQSLRSLLGDVVLDIILYYERKHREEILDIVVSECNRVYQLFRQHNPEFCGSVSIVGHSLGSAIAFDLLSLQPKIIPQKEPNSTNNSSTLDFPVENYISIGSPIGVFKLIAGQRITSRSRVEAENPATYDPPDPAALLHAPQMAPRSANFYNVFHPCDPVGYRVEPLIHKLLGAVDPEEINYATQLNVQLSEFESLGGKLAAAAADTWKNIRDTLSSKSPQLPSALNRQLNNYMRLSEALQQDERKRAEEDSRERARHSRGSGLKLPAEIVDDLLLLNKNGRVDYALKEGYFDLSVISTISSHISYWDSEDFAAFLIHELFVSPDREEVRAKMVAEEFPSLPGVGTEKQ